MDAAAPKTALADRIAALDFEALGRELDAHGAAIVPALLTPDECAQLADGYDDHTRYRSTVVMGRHGFGRGEYRYFAYPLPDLVAALREGFYPPLAAIANRWNA